MYIYMQYEEGVGLHTHSRGVAPSTPSTTSQVRLSIAVIVIYIYVNSINRTFSEYLLINVSILPSYCRYLPYIHIYI